MSRYTTEKNPHYDACKKYECEGCNAWSEDPCEELACDYFMDGYLAAEKEYALTDDERDRLRGVFLIVETFTDKNGKAIVNALKKKVLGE